MAGWYMKGPRVAGGGKTWEGSLSDLCSVVEEEQQFRKQEGSPC